ncbi:hypothetical protein ACJ73_09004, partial [Blastomyces percursus]
IISTQSGPSEGLSVEHDPALVESVDATIHPANEGDGSRSVELLAEQLVEQLEHHHGCSEAHHSTDPSVAHTVSLSEMAEWRCPDILAQTDICRYPTAWETILPPDQRRQLYSGIPSITTESDFLDDQHPSNPEASPPAVTVDLEHDAVPAPRSLSVQFDIDSAGGLASSLAVAREGLEWRAGRPPVSSLQSSLHLDPLPTIPSSNAPDPTSPMRPTCRLPGAGGFYPVPPALRSTPQALGCFGGGIQPVDRPDLPPRPPCHLSCVHPPSSAVERRPHTAIQQKSLDWLQGARQRNTPLTTFLPDFDTKILEAGGQLWEDRMKISMLKKARAIESRERETIHPTTASPPQKDPDTMEWVSSKATRPSFRVPGISYEDAADRRQRGVCINCDRPGHMAAHCRSDFVPARKKIRANHITVEGEAETKKVDAPAEAQKQGKD